MAAEPLRPGRHDRRGTLSTATWTIVGYLSLVALLGAWLSSRNRNSADWATGSGGMGIWMIAAGIAGLFGYYIGTASVLEWLLLGFAMVVPPAIAIGYIFYLPSTTEQGVFWGIASGYGLGLISWLINRLVVHAELDVAAYFTTIVPLIAIPVISALTRPRHGDKLAGGFYRRLRSPA